MKKRGQVTIFMIIGLVILIISGLVIYVNSLSAKDKDAIKTTKTPLDITPVKNYVTTCLKKVGDDALFDKIGLQGGYINPNNMPNPPGYRAYLGKNVPYFLYKDGNEFKLSYPPSLDGMEEKISDFIAAELETCLHLDIFNDFDFSIEKPGMADVEVNTSINTEDVSIKLKYPLTIKYEDKTTELEDFRVNLPIRLGTIYDSVNYLIEEIQSSQPSLYDISQHCNEYDTNGLTNIYFKDREPEPNPDLNFVQGVIQFMDFSTFYENYIQTYTFQFAIKDVNFTGRCAG